jgi:S-adenosylmethionine synthetase
MVFSNFIVVMITQIGYEEKKKGKEMQTFKVSQMMRRKQRTLKATTDEFGGQSFRSSSL